MPDDFECAFVGHLGVSFFLCTLEKGKDGHGMAMTQIMMLFKPSHNGTRFGRGRERTTFCPSLLIG
jgi:hypothetical protein